MTSKMDYRIEPLARKLAVSETVPQRHSQLRAAAEILSRRNYDAAIVELMMEAAQRVTMLAYEQDDDGFCNIDRVTGRLLIPAPWGRNGHQVWGLRSGESVILRELMQQRQKAKNGVPGLFLYERAGRMWCVNLFDFETYTDAGRYWDRYPFSVEEYRAARTKRLGR